MSLPVPHAGLVIRYAYLWAHEAAKGQDEGRKDRPCAVILVVLRDDGAPAVRVLPITHSPLGDPLDAVEIPPQTKRRLGLDDARSWIVVTEANDFLWPGPDLRPLPGKGLNSAVLGVLPPGLFRQVRERLLERRRFAATKRPG